jgi:hypothetical protein
MKSFALRQLNRIQEAWDFLLPVADLFPFEPSAIKDLACLACCLAA